MPALISIFSPEILFERVITPSSPITESLDPLFDKNQKSGFWSVPLAWEVKKAILQDPAGKIIADYKKNPLYVFTNSVSFQGLVNKKDLIKNHVFTDKHRPSIIPFHFRNSFRENVKEWGFSIPFNLVKKFPDGKYKVDIQTSMKKSNLYSSYYEKKGKIKDSILFVSHFDHPHQLNDGISGTFASYELLKKLKNKKFTYAGLATPEIIGSIFFAKKFAKLKKIKHAVMLNFTGNDSSLIYSKSSEEDSFIDKIVEHISLYKKNIKIVKFREIIGADEISFDNQINKIPCSSIYRWPFKHYHSNKDNFENFNLKKFKETINFLEELIFIVENNSVFFNRFKDLPKLSHPKLDLYFSPRYWKKNNLLNDKKTINESDKKIFNLIKDIQDIETRKACLKSSDNIQLLQSIIPTKCDGQTTILELANYCKMPFRLVNALINLWVDKKLLKKRWVNPLKNK